jgi:hypothetical protein
MKEEPTEWQGEVRKGIEDLIKKNATRELSKRSPRAYIGLHRVIRVLASNSN